MKQVSREELMQLRQSGAGVFEVLPAAEYQEIHIAGAQSLPLTTVSQSTTASLDHGRPTVVYCNDFQ